MARGVLLSEAYPNLYAQLHVNINKNHFPDIDLTKLTCSSRILVWWECPQYSHVWLNTPLRRTSRGHRCPVCAGRSIAPGWNCLEAKFPEIFKELHPTLNTEAGIDVETLAPKGSVKVWWQCQVNSLHIWQCRVSARTSGPKTGCPHCFTFRNEKEFRELFNTQTNLTFQSGHIIAERELFKRNKVQIDIVNHEHKIAIEYDGHFTHGGNTLYGTNKEECFAKDTDSTQAILKAGYTIIRIRETPLANLALKHPELKQLKYKNRTDKAETLQAAITYLKSRNKPIHIVPTSI